MRIPLFHGLLRRLTGRGVEQANLAEWEAKHRKTIAGDLEKIWHLLPEDLIFVDVGANIGLFSEALLQRRPGAKGYLFEPVQEMRARCAKRFVGDERVTLEPFALAHEKGTATIYKARYNPGGNSLVHELMYDTRDVSEVIEEPDHVEEEIRLEVFDDYASANGIEFVHFIKTDTEGFDYRVLQGMLGFLERCDPKPVILAELMSESYHPFWNDQMAVLEKIYAMGYGEVDLSNMDKVQDVLFVPNGR
ncbi:MAG: FkbM family methyltransferase [Candidatus Paceibacteria bacterium]|jgi:FkbM family methyltransferase